MSFLKQLKRRVRPYLPSGRRLERLQDRLLRRARLRRTRDPWPLICDRDLLFGSVLPLAIADVMLDKPEFSFLQIGAYDGVAHEDLGAVIERRRLRGVLVEPQPAVFKKLQNLYGDHPDLTLVNAAVDRRHGARELFIPPRDDTQIASFNPNHVMKYGFARHELIAQEVECLTIDEVLERAGIASVDLLQIDAEGYDHEILKGVDFDNFRPAIIRFEHRHVPPGEIQACLLRLAGHGYRFLCEANDVIAIQTDRARATGRAAARPAA